MDAAIAGGVTSLACPPDTDPTLDEPGLVEMLKFRAKNLNQAHVYPIGALTVGLKGMQLTEMAELTDAGCVAFSHADAALNDHQLLLRALQYAATFDYPVWLRAQDASLARGGVAHDGQVATRLGLPAIPASAETVALTTILLLARETGARIHLCRLSSADSVALIRQAKAEGLNLSCDVAIHHAHMSEMDIGYFDPNCRMTPPLRSQRDRDALRVALADGTIDALCSDHAPVDEDAKQVPFDEAEPGATGVELLLPLTLKWALESKLSLLEGLARITTQPARILGIAAGRIVAGGSADLCLFDPECYWKVTPAALRSQGKNTPFTGLEVKGKVRYTLIDGQIVYETK
jgi:dihydroorotase